MEKTGNNALSRFQAELMENTRRPASRSIRPTASTVQAIHNVNLLPVTPAHLSSYVPAHIPIPTFVTPGHHYLQPHQPSLATITRHTIASGPALPQLPPVMPDQPVDLTVNKTPAPEIFYQQVTRKLPGPRPAKRRFPQMSAIPRAPSPVASSSGMVFRAPQQDNAEPARLYQAAAEIHRVPLQQNTDLDSHLIAVSQKILLTPEAVVRYHIFKQGAQIIFDNHLAGLPTASIIAAFNQDKIVSPLESGHTLRLICDINDKFHSYLNAISPFLYDEINFHLINAPKYPEVLAKISENFRNSVSFNHFRDSPHSHLQSQGKVIAAYRSISILFHNYMRSAPIYQLVVECIATQLAKYGNIQNEVTEHLNRLNIMLKNMHLCPLILEQHQHPPAINYLYLPFGTSGVPFETLYQLAASELPPERLELIALLSNLQLSEISKTGKIKTSGFEKLSNEALRLMLLQRPQDYPQATGYELLFDIKYLMDQAYGNKFQIEDLDQFFEQVRTKTCIKGSDSDIALILFAVNRENESPFVNFIKKIKTTKYTALEIRSIFSSFCWDQWRNNSSLGITSKMQLQAEENNDEFAKRSLLKGPVQHFEQPDQVIIHQTTRDYEQSIMDANPIAGTSGTSHSKR